jgi:transcription antitermination factor NusG
MAWYALRVKPRFEKMVSCGLRGKGYDEFLPLSHSQRKHNGRTRTVDLPLFPGYLFCRFDAKKRLPIMTSPGVLYVVTQGDKLAPVRDEDIASVRIALESGLPVASHQYLPGNRVRVLAGPLTGVEGVVTRVTGKCRVVISVEMLMQSVSVDIAADWLTADQRTKEKLQG